MSTPRRSAAMRTGSISQRSSMVADSPSQKEDGSIEDDDEAQQEADLPMTMTASVVLAGLPKDAKTALEGVSAGGVLGGGQGAVAEKVVVSFHPIASAPRLRTANSKFKISSAQPFSTVIRFLRKKIGHQDEKESIFCYINQCFAPGLDENVGGLWACFKTGEELVVHYAIHPAFG
ncbi:APG12-domain-containing protein [Venturia nashicola]|uniref:Ubiquitin-like protein ATG12 n=1 Tax=Venturia nashicola TaxID=86259 RepID=A0A4Z1P7M9_9PEZI|nr:APG12-domain-containing protein [Venturia nashicola]TLD32329.1 APG12-domain-containing protein [Venturia nashicola]